MKNRHFQFEKSKKSKDQIEINRFDPYKYKIIKAQHTNNLQLRPLLLS